MIDLDILWSGLDQLSWEEGENLFLYVQSKRGDVHAGSYDPEVVATALGRLSAREQLAVTNYFIELCAAEDALLAEESNPYHATTGAR